MRIERVALATAGVALALLLAACGGDVTESAEYLALSEETDDLRERLDDTQQELATANDRLAEAEDELAVAIEEGAAAGDELESLRGDLAGAQSELAAAREELEQVQAALEIAQDPFAGEIAPWPAEIKEEFVRSCVEGAGGDDAALTVCTCMGDRLEQEIPLSALVEVGLSALADPDELDLTDPVTAIIVEVAFSCAE